MHRVCPACALLLLPECVDTLLATYPEHYCPRCRAARVVEFGWDGDVVPDVVVEGGL